MIIGISGKIGSGKDTVGKIIQYLTNEASILNSKQVKYSASFEQFCNPEYSRVFGEVDWKIKKFAGKLKECIAIILSIPVKDLEKEEVKNNVLSEEWIRYGYASGFDRIYHNGDSNNTETIMINEPCSKERYEQELRTNWQTAYKHEYTIRNILQLFGTEVGRSIHPNFWINALFADYIDRDHMIQLKYRGHRDTQARQIALSGKDPMNWIITDARFPNEADAIKARGGIVIRVNRDQPCPNCGERENIHTNWIYEKDVRKVEEYLCNNCGTFFKPSTHVSETSLDNYTFDYVIDNNGTIEELIEKVKNILIKEKIL